MLYRVIIFLALNFAALGIGGIFTSPGVSSDWYLNLSKAPWTPPGWVFGFAWTTIMICFAFYMAYAWNLVQNRKLLVGLFSIQWLLNVLWNPVFFMYHEVFFALILISSLTFLMGYFLIKFWNQLNLKSVFVFVYFIWLLIATSLNVYILIEN